MLRASDPCRWTNGRFKSTLHRVVNSNERFSTPFFLAANWDAEVGTQTWQIASRCRGAGTNYALASLVTCVRATVHSSAADNLSQADLPPEEAVLCFARCLCCQAASAQGRASPQRQQRAGPG